MRFSNQLWAQGLVDLANDQPAKKDQFVANFINTLRNKRQLKYLPKIMRSIQRFEYKDNVVISSSFPLEEDYKKELTEIIRNSFPEVSQPKLVFKVDQDLIGGIRLETVDKELNMSIDNNLLNLKEQLWKKV